MTLKPAPVSDWLIGFLAGPDLSEAIVGDLQEQAGATEIPKLSLAIAIVRSLPGLVQLGLSSVSAQRFRTEFGWLATLFAVAWIWELKIAQVFAWPIASSISTVSPFPVVLTCKLAYLILFSLGLVVLMSGWRIITRSAKTCWRVRTQRLGAACLAGLGPVLYLLTFPGPYDGHPAFRYVQVTLVGVVGLTVIILSRARLRWA
ncbi:MAG: hypothetical protein AAF331_00420 [Pseudomonadota bacterium]